VHASDLERALLGAAQLAECRIGDAEDRRRLARDRELVQRVEEQVL
jgi:hypothetical protein